MKSLLGVFKSALALLLVPVCLLCSVSCREEDEVISDEALEYFNKGLSAFNIADCRSVVRAYAVLKDGQSGEVINGYLLYEENLYRNEGHTGSRKSDTYYGHSKTPDQLLPADLTHLCTYYRKDDYVYREVQSAKKSKDRIPFVQDYSSAMGLYSLGTAIPSGQYGVKGDGVVRTDLRFGSDTCADLQEVFIYYMQKALFGREVQMSYTPLMLSAFMNEKNNRITSYSLSFTGDTELAGKGYTVSFRYEETFFDYDTKEQILFPDDLDSYKKAQ